MEQSQTRVEGSNFDIRKHLLEYDDVLNTQRARIYGQRDMIFTKEELTEDVVEMLRTELTRRIPEAMKDEESPWRLLAYLEDVQPPIFYENTFYPNYTQRIMLEMLDLEGGKDALRSQLLDLAEKAYDVELGHMAEAAQDLIHKSEETLNQQISDREDSLDTYLDGLADQDDLATRRAQEVLEELNTTVRLPIRLTNEQSRRLLQDPKSLLDRDQRSNPLHPDRNHCHPAGGGI